MAALIVTVADQAEWTAYIASLTPHTRLYTYVNNHAPTKADVYGTYTISSDGVLLSPIPGAWVYTPQGGGDVLASLPTFGFVFAASQTLYGLLLTDSANNLIGVAPFGSPVVVPGVPTAYNVSFAVDVN